MSKSSVLVSPKHRDAGMVAPERMLIRPKSGRVDASRLELSRKKPDADALWTVGRSGRDGSDKSTTLIKRRSLVFYFPATFSSSK